MSASYSVVPDSGVVAKAVWHPLQLLAAGAAFMGGFGQYTQKLPYLMYKTGGGKHNTLSE